MIVPSWQEVHQLTTMNDIEWIKPQRRPRADVAVQSADGKYKTTLDPQLSKKDQGEANAILNKLKGKSVEQQYQILQQNSQLIKGMAGRMGYYGNAKVFNQYKNSSIGNDPDFYPNASKGKSQLDYFNMAQDNGRIDRHIRVFRDFREADTNVRKEALKQVNLKWQDVKDGLDIGDLGQKQMEIAFNSLVDEQGHIRGYNQWQKELSKNFTREIVLTNEFGYKQKYTENTEGLSKFYKGIAGVTDPQFFTQAFQGEQKKVFIDAYNKFKKAYKKSFDDVNVKHVYDATLMDIGFGDERNQALSYRGVDLSVNKNNKLNT
jgi:hypothetical protein